MLFQMCIELFLSSAVHNDEKSKKAPKHHKITKKVVHMRFCHDNSLEIGMVIEIGMVMDMTMLMYLVLAE